MLGLYLHIPFCSAICNYCNFNRGLFDEGLKTRYVAALTREILNRPASGRPADTIFFGGGTPSLLEPEEIAQLIDACRASLRPGCRSRSHPRGQSGDGLDRAPGRVSRRGRQPRQLRRPVAPATTSCARLSRLHGADRARSAFDEARAAGFDNVSLDLMMWLPGQRVDDWLESVDGAIALGARASVAVSARGVSERAAQGRDGPLRAGRRRPTTTPPPCT